MNTSTARASYKPEAPIWLKYRSGKRFIAFTAFVAAFTDGFLYSAIVPILPFSLVDRSGVLDEDVQFWLSIFLVGYGLAMTIAAPLAGWASCRSSSRKIPFLGGLGLTFAATTLFCFGKAPWVLLIARACQGFSASVIYIAGLALVADSVDPDEMGTWIGFVLSGLNLGLLIAPSLAGLIYEKAGYYAVFSMILGVISFDVVLRLSMIEKRTAMKWLEMPYPNGQEDTDTLGRGGDSAPDSFGSPTDVASIEDEEQRAEPDETSSLLPQKLKRRKSWLAVNFPTLRVLIRSPRLGAAVYGGFIHAMLITSFDAILPLFVSRTFGWKPTAAGLIFFALTIPSLLGAAVGAASDRYGTRTVSLFGFVLTTPSLALLGLIITDFMPQKVLFCVLLVFVGVGLTLLLASLAADIFCEAELLAKDNPDKFDKVAVFVQAYSIFTAALGLGAAMGPGLAGFFYQMTNWTTTVGMLSLLCAAGSVPVFCYTGLEKKKSEGEGSFEQV